MMAEFEISFDRTLGNEGGYSNVAKDRGGETWRGIARKFWPNWEGWEIVDRVKAQNWDTTAALDTALRCEVSLHQHVRLFYLTNFWRVNRLDLLDARHQEVADKIFDMAVNCGVNMAGKVVQRWLNFGNRDQRDYADLKEDGFIGMVTVAAIGAVLKTRGLRLALFALVCEHYVAYRNIVQADPEQEVFWWGWLARNSSFLSERHNGGKHHGRW